MCGRRRRRRGSRQEPLLPLQERRTSTSHGVHPQLAFAELGREGVTQANEPGLGRSVGGLPDRRLHHGTLNAIFLPTLLRFNADGPGVQDKYVRLREAMRLPDGTDLADFIEQLNADIGLPANLAEMGVTTDDFPFLVEHAAKDVCNFTNARQVTPDDFPALYEQAMG